MGIDVGPIEVTDGLVFQIDAGNSRSYSGSGITVNALAGTGGTFVNGVGFTSSNIGAFVFDGTNDFINISTDPLDLGTSNFSVSVWFKTNATQIGTLIANQVNNGWNGFNFQVSALGYLIPTVDWGNSQQYGAINSSLPYNDNTWREVTFIMNGATVANWKLFVNGIQVNTSLYGGSVSTISGSGIGNTIPLTIGYRTFGNYYSGQIGRVLIYNRALSATEIFQNYIATKGRYR